MKTTLVALLMIVSVANAGDRATEDEIQTLIEKLAISQRPAAHEPFLTYNNPKNAELVRQVRATANEIEKFGIAAFPQLIAHIEDARQSVPFRSVLAATVGDACLSIIMRQVYALPDGYSDTGSLFRRGADGKLHEQPVWSKQIYDGVGARKWLTDRKGKTLRELQIEAVEWALEIQKDIGTRTSAERAEYIAPLEAQLAKLRREAEPDGAANGSQQIRSETNSAPPAAGSRR